MEIIDKIFDLSFVFFVVTTFYFSFSGEKTIKNTNKLLLRIISGIWCASVLIMILSKIAMVWLK